MYIYNKRGNPTNRCTYIYSKIDFYHEGTFEIQGLLEAKCDDDWKLPTMERWSAKFKKWTGVSSGTISHTI